MQCPMLGIPSLSFERVWAACNGVTTHILTYHKASISRTIWSLQTACLWIGSKHPLSRSSYRHITAWQMGCCGVLYRGKMLHPSP